MTRLFLKIYDLLSMHRKAAGTVTLLLLVLLAALATRMHYDEDISAFIPSDGQNEKYSEIFNSIGGENRIAVIFREKENDNAAITRAMERFAEIAAVRDTCGMIRNLHVKSSEEDAMRLASVIWQYYPLMLTDADYTMLDSLASREDFFAQRMENNKMMLMLPGSGLAAQGIAYDPLQASGNILKRLQAMGSGSGYETSDGYLYKDGCGIVLMESPFGISESQKNGELQLLLDSCMTETASTETGVTISAVGAPLIAATNAMRIKKDTSLAIAIAIVLIFAVLLYTFRRLSDLLWIAVSLLAGWIFALGVISLIRDSISLIVIGIGSVIIGIAANYPLHFIDHLKHEKNMREVLGEMVPPLLVGNITTVGAFLCLLLLDARAMRDLGLFASLMLIGTILFTLVCLPLFVKPHKYVQNRGRSLLPGLSTPGHGRQRTALFCGIIALTLVLWFFGQKTSFNSDMRSINYMEQSQREDLAMLTEGTMQTNIFAVAEGATLEEALRCNERLCEKMAGIQGIKQVSGIGGLILSDSLAERRSALWKELMLRRQPAKAVAMASEKAGFISGAFAPFYEMAENPEAVVQRYKNEKTLKETIGRQFILQNRDGYKIVNLIATSAENEKSVKESLALAAPEKAFVFSRSDMSSHLAETLSGSFDYIGAVCSIAVFLFLWLSFRSIELAILAFLPLAVSWVWILGIMGMLGMQFNIVNIILATFIFGQGDDYTIFITEGLMYEYTTGKKRLALYKSSVATSAVIMLIGTGALIVSRHPAMRSLAEVAVIGMITVVAMAYILPPLIFRYLTEKRGRQREYPVTLQRLAATAFALFCFVSSLFCFMIPYTLLVYKPLKRHGKGEKSYHILLQKVAHFVIRHIPGVKFRERNNHAETFSSPAVIICNHQSHLDVMAIMQLSPKIIILTNDWVWKNPFYGIVIHAAEFRPISNGYDNNLPYLRELVQRGYSIVLFPEGTRTPDGEIGRFHKGAFTLAKELGTDIVPLYLHGLYDVMPKHDFMLRRGSVTIEVGERIATDSFQEMTDRQIANVMRSAYKDRYAQLRQELETEEYMAPYIAYRNKYKVRIV